MNMLRFTANVSIAFKEYPFYERFQRAAELGFGTVEFMSPFVHDVEQVVDAVKEANLKVVQFNFLDGDLAAGERGHASHPNKQSLWRGELLRALELGRQLGVRQINSLVGTVLEGVGCEAQIECLVENLRWAVPHLEEAAIPLMVEALNVYDNPGYLLTTSREVLIVLDTVNSPWVRFQYDIYHMQRMEGDLVRTIRACIDRIGHVQIADNPGRHEPGTGEINYPFVLAALEETGYDGYIGLEYIPSGKTEDSFYWLPFDKRKECAAADLNL
ncbi:MAG: TIM barrel protein [Chloroflexi bacterium]|nr:TIM barrel protein [Chloroflexota bacterium]